MSKKKIPGRHIRDGRSYGQKIDKQSEETAFDTIICQIVLDI